MQVSTAKNQESLPHPLTFKEHYVAAQPTPYSFSSGAQPIHEGGVLSGGSGVWLQGTPLPNESRIVSAFVDGLGMVILDARWLLKKPFIPAA